MTEVSHYNAAYFLTYTHPPEMYEMFIYKHTETTEYIKK